MKPGRETNVWEIGSDAVRDIVIDDAGVSAFHSKIVNEGSRWKIIDQMSANGTYVNGAKSNISYLKHGDRVRIGPVECTFQLPTTAAARESSATGSARPRWLMAVIAFAITVAVLGAAVYFLGG
ncbi:MAG: FHA domain-containing protein [Gammaproteobacteria bacterium]|nr:FHA domain-containing protein [Gammaproteobacteria bacterium]